MHRARPMSACGATHTCGAGAYTGVSAVDSSIRRFVDWTQPQASQLSTQMRRPPSARSFPADGCRLESFDARNGFGCGPKRAVMQWCRYNAVAEPVPSRERTRSRTALARKHMVQCRGRAVDPSLRSEHAGGHSSISGLVLASGDAYSGPFGGHRVVLDAHSALLTGSRRGSRTGTRSRARTPPRCIPSRSMFGIVVCCAICCVSSAASRLNTCINVSHQ